MSGVAVGILIGDRAWVVPLAHAAAVIDVEHPAAAVRFALPVEGQRLITVACSSVCAGRGPWQRHQRAPLPPRCTVHSHRSERADSIGFASHTRCFPGWLPTCRRTVRTRTRATAGQRADTSTHPAARHLAALCARTWLRLSDELKLSSVHELE